MEPSEHQAGAGGTEDHTSSSASLVRADDLRRAFDDTEVVRGIDLDVPPGTVQGLIGPSGSGKTTTVRMLLGLLRPTAGTVRVLGEDPQDLGTADRRRIGYMPQLGVLHPDLTILDDLRYVAALYGVRDARSRIDEVLDLLDLGDAAGRRLGDASGGMQRRVALAAALLHEPDLLFLDEPTSGLDPILRQRVWAHIGRLRDEGRTVLVTTQIVPEATRCDAVLLIADGRRVADGTPADLRRRADGGDVLDVHTEEAVSLEAVTAVLALDRAHRADRAGEDGRVLRVVVGDAERDGPAVREALEAAGASVSVVERHLTDFDDVFVSLLEDRDDAEATTAGVGA